jgi:hypothetical protein
LIAQRGDHAEKLISREQIMEIIRRQFIWLSGLAVAAPPAATS